MAAEVGRGLAGLCCAMVVACSFSGPGQGTGPGNLGDDGGDMDDTGSTSEPDDGSASASAEEGEAEEGGGPGGSADETGGGPPVIAGAQIVFVAGVSIDVGEIDPANPAPLPPIVIRNDGDVDASTLSGEPLAPPLSWAGGAFPGVGGTCGGTLAPGQTCDLVLAPVPPGLGWSSQMLTIAYVDSGFSETAVATIEAAARGTSPELVENGSFTQGSNGTAPEHWSVLSGGWAITLNQGWDDNRSVFGGPATLMTTVSLAQEISLDEWADTISNAGLGIHIEGAGKGQYDDIDQWLTVVTELDANGNQQAVHSSTPMDGGNWNGFLHELAVQPTTRRLRLELKCVMLNGSNCNVWFDGVRAHAMYPPPAP